MGVPEVYDRMVGHGRGQLGLALHTAGGPMSQGMAWPWVLLEVLLWGQDGGGTDGAGSRSQPWGLLEVLCPMAFGGMVGQWEEI